MLGARIYTAYSWSGGELVDGVYDPGELIAREVELSVQPLRGSELVLVPEGARARHSLKAYGAPGVLKTLEVSGELADVVDVDGRRYQVQREQSYAYGWECDHSKYILVASEDGVDDCVLDEVVP